MNGYLVFPKNQGVICHARMYLSGIQFNGSPIKTFGDDKTSQKSQKGFTLIEVVMSMVILSFLSASILMFVKPVMNLWNLQTFQQGAATEGRLAMMRMVRDINQVRNRTSITTASAGTFTFTDTNNTAITYTTSSGSLTRNGIAIAKGVSGLAFAYYDVNNSVTATTANIRRITMQYTVTAGGKSVILRSQAHPRNLY